MKRRPQSIPIVQVDADTRGELRPCRHSFFERPNRQYHLTEIVGEPVMDGGLVRDFPTQRRQSLAEATFKVRVLAWTARHIAEVDDVNVLNRGGRS